jgi:hypothetical protein
LQNLTKWQQTARTMPTIIMIIQNDYSAPFFAFFVFAGVSDELKCFHCDGGLNGWEPKHDPWAEHAKWFPHCHHVILLKGKAFIEDIQKKVRIYYLFFVHLCEQELLHFLSIFRIMFTIL